MDVLSLIGVILAFVAIIGGNYLEGGHAGALVNGPAALIVIGGTLGAAFIQAPIHKRREHRFGAIAALDIAKLTAARHPVQQHAGFDQHGAGRGGAEIESSEEHPIIILRAGTRSTGRGEKQAS